MGFKEDFVREKLFLLGFASIFIGVMIFFGATPRGMKANAVGAAWPGTAVFVCLGLVLLGIDRYLNR
jgi:hypothetical protein